MELAICANHNGDTAHCGCAPAYLVSWLLQADDVEGSTHLKYAIGRPDIHKILAEVQGSQATARVIHVHAAGMHSYLLPIDLAIPVTMLLLCACEIGRIDNLTCCALLWSGMPVCIVLRL